MQRLLLTLAVLSLATTATAQDLMITGVLDGPLSGGQPKTLELRAINDIADLSVYSIDNANNGGAFDGTVTSLSGSIAAGEYLYITSDASSTTDPLDEFIQYFGFPADFYSASSLNVNGDDVLGLFENGMLIDVFGVLGEDGTGQPWEYLDGWAYTSAGRTPSTTFDAAEWTYSGVDATDGCVTNLTCASPFPSTNPLILPVELTSFEAIATGSAAKLTWTTASETNNAGFDVQQAGANGWASLGFVAGNGTTLEAQRYSFETATLAAGTYRFRLRQVDFDGAHEYSAEVELTVGANGPFTVTAAQPNPFTTTTAFAVSVDRSQQVTVELYNLLGQRVATLLDEQMGASTTRTITVDAGTLPAGLYLYRVQGETFATSRQVTLLR